LARLALERKPAIATSEPLSGSAAKSIIVTVRRKEATILPPGLLPDTPAEYQRRGDAADALWPEIQADRQGAAVSLLRSRLF
jgi:hypothetical protein